MAPLQVSGGTIMRVKRTTILLISLTLIGFLIPPHTCKGATLPMLDLGSNTFAVNHIIIVNKPHLSEMEL